MLTFEEDKNFESAVNDDLLMQMVAAGGDAAEYLQDRLSYHQVSGHHWRENPNQSSAFGEYPQEQTGDLKNSVEMHIEQDEMAVNVGLFSDDPRSLDKFSYLEFFSHPGHDEENSDGTRRPLWMTFEGDNSTEVHDLMADAIERNG